MARIGGHGTALAARAALVEAVAVLGPHQATADPRLPELVCGLTDTESAETQRWVRVILEVAEAGVVPDLFDPTRRADADERVCGETPLSFDSARWAIEAWCEALGVESPPEVPFVRPPRIRMPRREGDEVLAPPPPPELKLEAAASLGSCRITVAACSPDGRLVATAGGDQAVRVHCLGGPAGAEAVARHDGPVVTLAFSPDGETLASGSNDGTVCLSRPGDGGSEPSGQRRAPLVLTAHPAGVGALAFNAQGSLLATASESGAITLWDSHLGVPVRKISGHDAAVTAVAFRANGRVLVSGGEDDTVRMWLSASGTAGHVLPLRGPVVALGMDDDGARLAVSRRMGFSVRRFAWPANVSPITATLGAMLRGDVFFLTGAPWAHDSAGIRTFAFDPTGNLLATGAADGSVTLWRADTGTPLGRSAAHDGPVLAVRFSPDGTRLMSVGADCLVRRWRWRP